jgi:hypothetical protein
MTCCAVYDDSLLAHDVVARTECRRACGAPSAEDVCATSRDCPPFLLTGVQGGLVKMTCVPRTPSPNAPPWARRCEAPRR